MSIRSLLASPCGRPNSSQEVGPEPKVGQKHLESVDFMWPLVKDDGFSLSLTCL